MAVPGSNLLTTALGLICPEPIQFYQFTGFATNAIGYDVRTYAAPTTVMASVQAVDRTQYSEAGLDFNKRHIAVWASQDIDDLYRGRAGDQIGWQGVRWEVLSESEWHPIDGWNNLIAVQVDEPL